MEEKPTTAGLREKAETAPWGGCRRIAVFRALKLGDLLCSIPFFRALRHHFSRASITLISLPWASVFRDRFSHYIDEFMAFPGYPGLSEIQHPDERAIERFFISARQKKFDLVLQIHGNGHIVNRLVEGMGARFEAGFYPDEGSRPRSPLFMPYPAAEHEVWRALRLLDHLGIEHLGAALEFPLRQSDMKELMKSRLYRKLTGRPYVCIHPGASVPSRQWEAKHFALVGDSLVGQGFEIVLTGIKSEAPVTALVAHHMQHKCHDFASAGLSLGASARLVSGAQLLVANDTGMGHLAAALGVPSVIIFANPAVIPYWYPVNPARLVVVNSQSQDCLQHAIASAIRLCEDERYG